MSGKPWDSETGDTTSLALSSLKDILNSHLTEMPQTLELNADIWAALKSAGVISEADRQRIELNKTNHDQVYKLCEHLQKQPVWRFHKFIKVLPEETKRSVCDLLKLPYSMYKGPIEKEASGAASAPPKRSDEATYGRGVSKPGNDEATPKDDIMDIDEDDTTSIITVPAMEVKKCEQNFYEKMISSREVYEMDKIRRGKCLIITGSERNLEEGYNADRKNLDGLFKGLHFEACYPSKIEIRDLPLYRATTVPAYQGTCTAQEIVDVVQAFASDETHKDANCAVLCILSHGGNEVIDIQAPRKVRPDSKEVPEYILGSDGIRVEIKTIVDIMRGSSVLYDKPILIFDQACAGRYTDFGVNKPEDHQHASRSAGPQTPAILPYNSNMFLMKAAQEGKKAWVAKDGSRLVKALVNVFREHACDTSLQEMDTMIRGAVSKHGVGSDEIPAGTVAWQLSRTEINLLKLLYFFPGITLAKQDESK